MNQTTIPDLLKIILPALIVLGAMFLLVKSFLLEEREKRSLELKLKTIDKMLPLRLNAYERVIVYVERANPSNLILRNYEAGISARQLQMKTLDEIRTEFEHNLSQQIYISEEAWQVVKKIKDETSILINDQTIQLPEGASGAELSRKILEKTGHMDPDPYDYATLLIKREIRQLF
jgi:hypothetical protein